MLPNQLTHPTSWVAAMLISVLSLGCAGTYEQAVHDDIQRAQPRFLRDVDQPTAPDPGQFQRGLPGYIAYALEQNPELRAAFERWQASIHRISRARRLPEPTISYGFFLRNVETRVGPQRHRVSLQQSFPWPTKLSAGADAASAQARAIERRFDALSLVITQRVVDAYYKLWLVRRLRVIHSEHLEVLRGLSESALARLATGSTTLADQQQIDLSVARMEDSIRGLDEAERSAAAHLRAAIGAAPGVAVPTPDDPPNESVPGESEEALRQRAILHPLIQSFALMSKASQADAEREEADRYPSFTIGLDWIETGPARMPNVPDSGKDAVIIGAGMKIPLWQGSYGDSVAAAHSEALAQRADERAAKDRTLAELEASLSAVRDSARRVKLYRDTLVPQAEAAYGSVLGAYTTGRATVSATLLAQRDLLDLRIELDRARADHAQAWARLEQVVGSSVSRKNDARMTPSGSEQ